LWFRCGRPSSKAGDFSPSPINARCLKTPMHERPVSEKLMVDLSIAGD
jgi:hypothetical protein